MNALDAARIGLVAIAVWCAVPGPSQRTSPADARIRGWMRVRGVDPAGIPVHTAARTGGLVATILVLVTVRDAPGLLLAGLVGLASLAAPGFIARQWAARREHALARALAPFLRAWATALDAGAHPWIGYTEAVRNVGPPLRVEMLRVQARVALRAGTLATVLADRAHVLRSPALAEIGGVLAATDRTGAPLAVLLRRLADDLDARHGFADQLAAAARGPQREILLSCAASVAMAAALPSMLGRMCPPGSPAPPLAHWEWAVLAVGAAVPMVVLVRERARALAET